MKVGVKTKQKKQPQKNVKKKTNKSNRTNPKKQNTKKGKIAMILCFIILIIILLVLIIHSSLFNIENITVLNNYKVDTTEIIQKSGLFEGNNMFKTLNSTSKTGIKSNPYIEDVKITKKLNGEVFIEVTERTATYMLPRETDYAYINNQGYVLETTNTPLELPIIKGYSTKELIPGNRIDVNDLKKLDVVIQIMESAKSNGIKELITSIDISDENNFILEIPSEAKTVQFGDKSSINVKVLWIVDLINREKGIEGEIIVNVPNIKKVYFREKV